MIRARQPSGGRLASLHRDSSGVAAIEFAIVAPVFITLLIGTLDIGHWVYAKAVLAGAVQKAARESTLEDANTTTADDAVMDVIGSVLPGAVLTSTRKSYYDFTDVGRPESWNDVKNNAVASPKNSDGICNNGETYTDENGNDQWDADVGVSGNGGASDVVFYTVTVTYSPVFRLPYAPASWAQRTISATAVRKNQPFSKQSGYGSTAGTCSG